MKETLSPEYFYGDAAARYLNSTERKLALFRKYGLIRWSKLGKSYCYRKLWLDQFMEEWSGYDLSNEANIQLAVRSKEWKVKHG